MTKRKTTMVAPPPARPTTSAKQLPILDVSLATVLTELGNTRAYTLISARPNNSWLVHFEGDYEHSIVKFEKGKPVIVPAK